MINLIKEGTSNTIAISPISQSLYHDLASGSFELDYTQDYDQSSGSIFLSKLPPVPAGYYNNYLLFSVTVGSIPDFSGFYTYDLQEYIAGPNVWSLVSTDWDDATWAWGSTSKFNLRSIDQGRMKVVGTDEPSYIRYTDADQDGQYKTYHK